MHLLVVVYAGFGDKHGGEGDGEADGDKDIDNTGDVLDVTVVVLVQVKVDDVDFTLCFISEKSRGLVGSLMSLGMGFIFTELLKLEPELGGCILFELADKSTLETKVTLSAFC